MLKIHVYRIFAKNQSHSHRDTTSTCRVRWSCTWYGNMAVWNPTVRLRLSILGRNFYCLYRDVGTVRRVTEVSNPTSHRAAVDCVYRLPP